MVSVVSTWHNTIVSAAGVSPGPNPANQSLEVPVANSGLNNNWMFAIVSWATPAPYTTTVAVGDDAGNLWEPLGAPSGTSSALGNVRTAIWFARNARTAANVFVSPTGFAPDINCLVAEINGLSPWATFTGLTTGFANSATSLGPLAVSYPPTSVPLNQNTLTGQSISPWTSWNGGSIASSNAWGSGSDWSLMLTGNGTTANPATGSESTIPVTATTEYTAAAVVVSPSGFSGGAQIGINWYNASSGYLSSSASAFIATPAAQAVLLLVSAAAPATAAFAEFWVQSGGTPPTTSPLFVSNATFGVPSQALMFAACAGDLGGLISTGPGSGWTSFPNVSSTPMELVSAWQVASAPVTATWTTSGSVDLAGIVAGLLVTGIAPTPASTTWPLVQAQAAFGSGAVTPWDQQTWTGMSTRFVGLSLTRGKQYELDQIQSGTGNWTWRNNDGALMPQLSTGVYAPYVQAFTPVRLLVTWPPPPAANARTYVVNRTYMERWPSKLTNARYQQAPSISADAWAVTTALLQTIARAEVLQDSPYAYWPLDDPAGASYGANIAPGNTNALLVVQSKYGPGAGKYTFGVSAEPLIGDPSTSTWQQTGLGTANQGYCLYCQDNNLPGITAASSPGVTISGWFNVLPVAGQPAGNLDLMTITSPKGITLQLYIPQSGGQAGQVIALMPAGGGSFTAYTITFVPMSTGNWFQLAVVIHPGGGTFDVYVNGVAAALGLSPYVIPESTYFVEFCGTADRVQTGGMWNGQVAHCAVFPGLLPAQRIASQYLAMLYALYANDTSGQRIERLLLAGKAAVPRCIPAGSNTVVGATDIGGNACGQNVVNIAESDNSLLMVNSAGYLYLQQRLASYNLPISWYFGEDVAAPLNQNWTFESGVAPWTGVNGATLSQSALWSMQGGLHSALFTGNGSTSTPSMQSENVPVIAGTTYTFSTDCYSPQGWANGCYWFINWLNASLGVISSSSGAGAPTTIPASVPTGTPVTFTARAPAGAAYATLFLSMSGTPANTVQMFADQAMITTTYTEQPYLDDFATDFDPAQVFNDVTLSQLATPSYLSYSFSASSVSNIFNAAGSNFVAGQAVVLAGASLPGGFTAGLTYYVINVNGSTFQLSATSGGSSITISSSGTGTISGVTAAVGVTIAVNSAASILMYGDQTVQETVYLTDPNVLTDLAYWIINTLGAPSLHITQMTLDPSANPALWPVVLGLESGQVVWVNRRLGGTYPEISGYFQVMTVGHSIGARSWKTVVSLLPYFGNVLTLGDPERGVLIGNPLGW